MSVAEAYDFKELAYFLEENITKEEIFEMLYFCPFNLDIEKQDQVINLRELEYHPPAHKRKLSTS